MDPRKSLQQPNTAGTAQRDGEITTVSPCSLCFALHCLFAYITQVSRISPSLPGQCKRKHTAHFHGYPMPSSLAYKWLMHYKSLSFSMYMSLLRRKLIFRVFDQTVHNAMNKKLTEETRRLVLSRQIITNVLISLHDRIADVVLFCSHYLSSCCTQNFIQASS